MGGYLEKVCLTNDFSEDEAGEITRNIGMQGVGMVRNKNSTYEKINYLTVLKRHKISIRQ